MNAIRQEDFAAAFEAFAGFPPMRWQARLYSDWFARGRIPAVLPRPVGRSRAAGMTLWLIARAGEPAPLRQLAWMA